MGRPDIAQLSKEVQELLRRQNYAEITIKHYRETFNRFGCYANSKGEAHYSDELAKGYIEFRYGYNIDSEDRPSPNVTQKIRGLRILKYYEMTGLIPGRITYAKEPPPCFAQQYDLYINECIERDLSGATIKTRSTDICDFLIYVRTAKSNTLPEIDHDIIQGFLLEKSRSAPGGMSRLLSSLRCFLRAMFAHSLTETDLSLLVPKASRYPRKPVHKLWLHEEVEGLLDSISRTDSPGKRNYAIILLIAKYGMRDSDVVNLKLSDIDWDSKTIHFYQHKTDVPNTLPITDDVGWALVDWLTNARPKQATTPCVFTRLSAPYCQMYDVGTVLERCMARAGISKQKGINSGPHSLRHTLASNMLAEEVPFPIISSVLGHISQSTTMIYLHADIEGLRKCAIDVGGDGK